MNKICTICKKSYPKSYVTSRKEWSKSRFCSLKCYWKYLIQAKIHPPPRTGTTPWNKGLKGFRAGELNNHWKGGISRLHKTERQLAMLTIDYKLWRSSVFERDNFTCVICKKHGVKLEADHVKPWVFYPELRYKIDNGRTLCVDCHRKVDTACINQFSCREDFEWDS